MADQRPASSLPASPARYGFGIFELDRTRGVLYRKGVEVKLQPQPMAILVTLVERAGQEVSREDLRAQLWPEGTFVEFESSINTAVRKIRQALGDSPENPIFIRTIHGKGFCFIAPVHLVVNMPGRAVPAEPVPLSVAPSAPATAAEASSPSRTTSKSWLWLSVGAGSGVVALALIVLGIASSFRGPAALPVVSPLTSFAGDEYLPSFSPDGREVVYAWAGEDDRNVDLYLMETGGGRALRRLTTDPARDEHPMWSPDGRWIAFVRSLNQIMLISPLGGNERVLGEMTGEFLAWTPDSRELLVARMHPGGSAYCLYAVSVATGESRQISSPEEKVNPVEPFGFSSDGHLLAYTRSLIDPPGLVFPRLSGDRPVDLFVRDAGGGAARRLTRFETSMRGWTWIPGTAEIVFCSNHGGSFTLWRVNADRPDREPEPVAGAGWGCGYPVAARDPSPPLSMMLAYEHRDFVMNLHEFELSSAPNAGAHGGQPVVSRILASTKIDDFPQFSPDGEKLLFISDRTGFPEVWVAGALGQNPSQLSSFGVGNRQLETPRWSPDGKEILFMAVESGSRNLYAMPAGGGKLRRLMQGHAHEVNPTWSRDGRWIYFASIRSGSWQIWKAAYDSRAVTLQEHTALQMTDNGGVEGYESEDGRLLYYKNSWADTGLWSVPASLPGTGGRDAAKSVMADGIWDGWWSVAAGGIFFVDLTVQKQAHVPPATPKPVYFLDPATGKRTKVIDIRQRLYSIIPNLAVAPGGRRVVFGQLDYSNIDLYLMRNFR